LGSFPAIFSSRTAVEFLCCGDLPKTGNSVIVILMTGWWLTYPSEKYEFVNWNDDIPNIWKNKSHVPNHQPVMIIMVGKLPPFAVRSLPLTSSTQPDHFWECADPMTMWGPKKYGGEEPLCSPEASQA